MTLLFDNRVNLLEVSFQFIELLKTQVALFQIDDWTVITNERVALDSICDLVRMTSLDVMITEDSDLAGFLKMPLLLNGFTFSGGN